MSEKEDALTDAVVKLRGLPWLSKEEDILDFFKDINVKNGKDGIHLTCQDGRATGEAFVELCTESDKAAALEMNGKYIGKRYIEIKTSSRALMNKELCDDVDARVVKLRGLPYSSTDEDIAKFFSGYQIEDIIIQTYGDSGRQTGEAFVVFADVSEAERSLSKHKDSIGTRYIEIFSCSVEDIKAVVYNKRGGPYEKPHMGGYHSGSEKTGYMSKRGSGYGRLYRGGGAGAGAHSSPPYGGYSGNSYGYGGPRPGGKCEHDRYNEYGAPPRSVPPQGSVPPLMPPQQLGGHYAPHSGPGQMSGYVEGPDYQHHPGGSYGGGSFNEPGYYHEAPGHSEMVSYPPIQSSVGGGGWKQSSQFQVRLRGLPYESAEKDIIEFLRPIQTTSVELLLNRQGRASGEAIATFETQHAMDEALKKHKEYIGSRYVEVFAVNQPKQRGNQGGYGSHY